MVSGSGRYVVHGAGSSDDYNFYRYDIAAGTTQLVTPDDGATFRSIHQLSDDGQTILYARRGAGSSLALYDVAQPGSIESVAPTTGTAFLPW